MERSRTQKRYSNNDDNKKMREYVSDDLYKIRTRVYHTVDTS